MTDMTRKDIAQAIGWLDAFGSDAEIEFYSCDWSQADENGKVHIEGRTEDGGYIEVTVQIVSFSTMPPEPEWDDDWDPEAAS